MRGDVAAQVCEPGLESPALGDRDRRRHVGAINEHPATCRVIAPQLSWIGRVNPGARQVPGGTSQSRDKMAQ